MPCWFSCSSISSFSFLEKPFRFFFFFIVSALEVLKLSNFKYLSLGKASYLYAPLMVDFAFIRQEYPSISFIFARLGVFLEYSASWCPQVDLFMPHFIAFRPVLLTLLSFDLPIFNPTLFGNDHCRR